MARIFRDLRNRVPGIEKVVLSAHNHNDLGMAVANTLAAIQAGVRQIESTINGIGERAGNASLEEVAMALRTRRDALPYRNNIVTPKHPARPASCWPPSPASTCSRTRRSSAATPSRMRAGIHQDGVLKDASTYEIMTPESVGWTTKQPGAGQAFRPGRLPRQAEDAGLQLGDNALNDAFRRFKDLADRKKVVYDEDVGGTGGRRGRARQ